jgi:tetratricopeptide (TPR) repeat protein
MALACHKCAVALRESANPLDPASTATSLVAISNTYWTRLEYEEAITSAERALVLHKTLVPYNEIEVGKTLAMLGNIYQDCGNDLLAKRRKAKCRKEKRRRKNVESKKSKGKISK